MRPALLSLLCLLTACGGLRAKGDAAFERGDHRLAVAYYHALMQAEGLSDFQVRNAERDPKDGARYEARGKLSLPDHKALIQATRRALRGHWGPAVSEAKALFDDGYPVLALQLAATPCEPGGRFRVHGEVVPGACALVDQIVQRLEREAGGGGMPDFTRTIRVRAAVARAFPWAPPAHLSEPLASQVYAAAKHAKAEGQHAYEWAWLASLTRAQGQTPSSRTGQFKIPHRARFKDSTKARREFNLAAYRMASDHNKRSQAVQSSRPWLAQIHAALAKHVDPQRTGYGAAGGVNLEPGAVRGACAAEARKLLARKDAGPKVMLDLQIRDCARQRLTRTRRKRKTQAYKQTSTHTVRDPIHRYEMQEVCEDVSVCRFPRQAEKYWLTWNTCAREHVAVERRCRRVRVRVGTDWSAPRAVTSRRKKYRTVMVDEPYSVHRWTFDAQVTATVGGQVARYRVQIDEEGADARSLGFRGWRKALTALATDEALVRLLRGQEARDPVDDLARRLVAGEPLSAGEMNRLSDAAGAPAWVIGEAFQAVARDPAVTFHRMALAEAPKAVDWSARWVELPPWTSKADRDLDGLGESVHIPRKLLNALRAVELEQLPDVRWHDVLFNRLGVDRALPQED